MISWGGQYCILLYVGWCDQLGRKVLYPYCTAFELFEVVFLWDVTTLDTVFFDSQIESWMALHGVEGVRNCGQCAGKKRAKYNQRLSGVFH